MLVTSVNVCVGGCAPNAPPYPSWLFRAANLCVNAVPVVGRVDARVAPAICTPAIVLGWENRTGVLMKLTTLEAAVEDTWMTSFA